MIPPATAKKRAGRTPARGNWRLLLRKLHLYVGLTFGLLLSFMGLTGSLLVFEHEIDEWLNPALLSSPALIGSYSLDEVLATAQRYDNSFHPQRLETARTASSVVLVRGRHGAQRERIDLFIDPGSQQVLGSRVWGQSGLSFIYKLHYTLLMGDTGRSIVGVAGLMLLLMSLSGLALWWPKKGKWKQAITIKWRAKPIRIIWDIHRSVGFFSALLLSVIALSGVYMTFPQYVKPAINALSPLTPAPAALTSGPAGLSPPLSLAALNAISEASFPNTELKRIYFPQDERGVFQVVRREADAAIKSSGYSRLWVDQYSGEILAVRSPHNFSAGDYFAALQFPLHNGEALGLIGRLLVLGVSFTPLLLFVSGFWLWRKRSAARR